MQEDNKRVWDGGVAVQASTVRTGAGQLEREPGEEPWSLSIEDLLVGPDSEFPPVLSVVMPTMNEEEGIGTCLDWIEEAILELEVPTEIIVSDASTDRTPEIARKRGAIVVEPDEPGYGYAYRYAFRYARGEYIVMGDADTTYDFSEIPRLLEHLEAEDADIVMGSRLEGEIKPGAMPALHQYVGNPLLTKFLNTFYDAGVSDAHSGFRVFRRDVLEQLDLTSDGMEFASEMVMKAGANALTIREVPITYYEREGEAKLESFHDGWRHVRFMLVNAPGYLFSIPAVSFGVVGLSMMAMSLVSVQLLDIFFGAHTAIAGSLLTIIGFQIGTLALFSAVTADPIQAPDDRVTLWIHENVHLEHGLAVGFGLFVLGVGYLVATAARWFVAGGEVLPLIVPNMLAFTAVVVGVQAIFSSFFLNMIADDYR
jgi:glycosyltransferase involved in cell wall biosynthesis